MTTLGEIIDARLSEHEGREKTSWYATDMLKCPAAAYWSRQGVEPTNPPDARTRRIFSVGSRFEDWIVDTVQEKYPDAYKPETMDIFDGTVRVRPDLIIPSLKLVYEIKTVHSKKFWYMDKGEGADEHYLAQLWCGLKATGIKRGILSYFSKDDLASKEYEIGIEDPVGAKVEAHVRMLNEAWDRQEVPTPTCVGTWWEKYCPYAGKCKQLYDERHEANRKRGSDSEVHGQVDAVQGAVRAAHR